VSLRLCERINLELLKNCWALYDIIVKCDTVQKCFCSQIGWYKMDGIKFADLGKKFGVNIVDLKVSISNLLKS